MYGRGKSCRPSSGMPLSRGGNRATAAMPANMRAVCDDWVWAVVDDALPPAAVTVTVIVTVTAS